MKLTSSIEAPAFFRPIGLVEEYYLERDWMYERRGDEEIAAEVSGRWCSFRLYFVWKPELDSLQLTCGMDMKIPEQHRSSVQDLLCTLNARLWMGHFELSAEESLPTYRYCLTLRGTKGVTQGQLEDLIDAAIQECDRFYPALQFVLWGGGDARETALAALLDTAGEA